MTTHDTDRKDEGLDPFEIWFASMSRADQLTYFPHSYAMRKAWNEAIRRVSSVDGGDWGDQIIPGTVKAFTARMKHMLENKGSKIGLTDNQATQLANLLTKDADWLMRAANFFERPTPDTSGEGELRDKFASDRRKDLEDDFYRGKFADYSWARSHIIWLLHELELMQERRSRPSVQEASTPIDMILFCPRCGRQHVDEPDDRTPDWTNPPHRSHLCHNCNFIWRPADIATNGVRDIKTSGKKDMPYAGAVRAVQEAEVAGEELRETLAEAMWNAYLASPIAKPDYQGVTWSMIRKSDSAQIKELHQTGLAEVDAMLAAISRLRSPRQTEVNANG